MAHDKLKSGGLLIKGGHVIDPAAKIDGPDGRVAA